MTFRLGSILLIFPVLWFLPMVGILWALAAVYFPIVMPSLEPLSSWFLSLLSVLGVFASLLLHGLAHAWAAVLKKGPNPVRITLWLLGDASQSWPLAPSLWREIICTLAGPLMNAVLAALSFVLYLLQFNSSFSAVMVFISVWNAALVVYNMAPGFPFDGGRLLRSVLAKSFKESLASSVVVWIGRVIFLSLIAYGVQITLREVRFAVETGFFLFLWGVLLFALSFWPAPLGKAAFFPPAKVGPRWGLLKASAAIGLASVLLALFSLFIPLMDGLEAPGVAVSVEEMIIIPQELAHPPAGSFLLTSVYSQTPILFWQWLYGVTSPVARVVPPEMVVSPETTPQEMMQREYRSLAQSEINAIYLVLRLVGYDPQIMDRGKEGERNLSEGINQQTSGEVLELPFPVRIEPKRIV